MFAELNKNSKKTVRDGINTDEMKFIGLKDLCGEELKVDGFFFTSSPKYGEQVVVVANGKKVNLPKRYTDIFKSIRDNDDQLKAVLDGHMGMTNIHMVETDQNPTPVFDFKDI